MRLNKGFSKALRSQMESPPPNNSHVFNTEHGKCYVPPDESMFSQMDVMATMLPRLPITPPRVLHTLQPLEIIELTEDAAKGNELAQSHFAFDLQAEEEDDMLAQYYQGLYWKGKGDHNQAVLSLTKAASQGMAKACFRLVHYYEKGIGVKQNHDTAIRYLIQAASKGHPKAIIQLANRFYHGGLMKQDKPLAKLLLHKLADTGHNEAQTLLESLIFS